MRGWSLRVAGAAFVAAVVVACTLPQPNEPSNVIVTQAQTVGGAPGASPSPGIGGDLPPGSTVRVGLFGQTCPSGVTAPQNGAREIKVGCTGHLTCTPKDSQGNDLPAAVHGPTAAWSTPFGSGNVFTSRPSEVFNLDARGVSPGTVRFECTVKNITGGTDFAVVGTSGDVLSLDAFPPPPGDPPPANQPSGGSR